MINESEFLNYNKNIEYKIAELKQKAIDGTITSEETDLLNLLK